jgi:hypothetical protein
VTLLNSYIKSTKNNSSVTCKRADVLKLELEDYKSLGDRIEEGLKKAAELLAEEKIFDVKSLPYATQLIPLSAICAQLGSMVMQHGVKKKLIQWYWCGVFGELYGGANETRFALDLPDVVSWVNGGTEPRTVRDASFAPIRLLSLQSRNAAAYKGLAALLMQYGSKDFVSGTDININTYFNNAIDIHHIFPRAWCEKQKYSREKWNSVVNKAPIASGTNRFIGGVAPSEYLSRIQKKAALSDTDLNKIIETHLIPVTNLRSDDFYGFIIDRANSLLKLIEAATGKVISGRDSDETEKAFGAKLY